MAQAALFGQLAFQTWHGQEYLWNRFFHHYEHWWRDAVVWKQLCDNGGYGINNKVYYGRFYLYLKEVPSVASWTWLKNSPGLKNMLSILTTMTKFMSYRLTGLGAPYWNQMLVVRSGLTRGTSKEDFYRAACNLSPHPEVRDIIDTMQVDAWTCPSLEGGWWCSHGLALSCSFRLTFWESDIAVLKTWNDTGCSLPGRVVQWGTGRTWMVKLLNETGELFRPSMNGSAEQLWGGRGCESNGLCIVTSQQQILGRIDS